LKVIPVDENPPMNYAVNNDGDYYPRYVASNVHPGSSLAKLSDGQYVYDIRPSNRWTTTGSPDGQDWVEVDFGNERPVDTVKLYVVDDGGSGEGKIAAPARIQLGYWDGSAWKPVPDVKASAEVPLGGRPHTLSFPLLKTSRLRAVLTHAAGSRSGLTEFEAWGPGVKPYVPAPPPAGNIAFNRTEEGFPKASASHSDVFGGLPPRAIDGKIIFEATPMNRWTCYGSPNATDSYEVDFGKNVKTGRAVLHIYDDRGGVQAPSAYTIEGWNGSEWKAMAQQEKAPEVPTGNMANVVTFTPVEVSKLRVVFTHNGNARSGMTEFEVWEK
jgi:F5/8 type C domain